MLVSLGIAVVAFILWRPIVSDLKILVVTGEGLQETYGFYNESHTTNGYNYYRDAFWTESTDKWFASTIFGNISTDSLTKAHGDRSVLFNFNAKYPSYYFYHLSRPYGYLAKEGERWMYFSVMFNSTAQINEFEVKATDYGGKNYFTTRYSNISAYEANEWIRFGINMNNMSSFGSPNWRDISRLQFNVQQSTGAPLRVWIDDLMMTSTYQYDLALKSLQALFKTAQIDTRDYGKLPNSIDGYTAVIYFDNRINSTGATIIDQYVNRGGGLVLLGLSTLWQRDGTEGVDFPLGAAPVSIRNSTETFIDDANKVDWFENHPALKPWNNYTIFSRQGYSGFRPFPYLGIAEIYGVSLREGATALVTEGGYIYEAVRQYGAGKVVYFAENLAKRIANGMLEASIPLQQHGFGSRGWGGATADRLQLLESALEYVSKYRLPKLLMVPSAKKGAFVFAVEISASIDQYWYLNQSCTNVLGSHSNDTAFWYTIQRMKNQSEETGVTFTLLLATEQLVNENRTGHDETEFTPRNLEALLNAYQSPNIEIGLSASNVKTWPTDSRSIESAYQNMWQGILDIHNALSLYGYEPLVWRYPAQARQGESMYGTARAGLYLNVGDEYGSVVVPYINEADTWNLQERRPLGGLFVPMIESGNNWSRKREETTFDWFAENDIVYYASTNDLTIAADPTHIHRSALERQNHTSSWVQTPTFLEYVSSQRESTWVTGGVTFAQYLKNWSAASVSTSFESKTNTYTFSFQNAPNGLTVRLPLNNTHVSSLSSDVEYILKEKGNYAYLALKNPKSSETLKVTIGTTKITGSTQSISSKGITVLSLLWLYSPLGINVLKLLYPLDLRKSQNAWQVREQKILTYFVPKPTP